MTPEEAMEQFKQLCLEESRQSALYKAAGDDADEIGERMLDPDQEQDWFSLSLGFFRALGLPCDVCHNLALKVRYDHHYWC